MNGIKQPAAVRHVSGGGGINKTDGTINGGGVTGA